jgi:nucleotide-binding universal stress UspA family protein
MKKILTGYDGSEGSKKALNKAISLIQEGGEIIILGVVPTPSDRNLMDQTTYECLKKKAHEIIDDVIKDFGSHGYNLTGMVEEGDAAAKIIDIANKLDCDLIVLGGKGTSEIGRYPIGSVANKVVQYAYKPVMVVR